MHKQTRASLRKNLQQEGLTLADVRELYLSLTEREQDVIGLRYALTTTDPLTLAAIGEKYDISRERVRQIERDAISRMAHLKAQVKTGNYSEL